MRFLFLLFLLLSGCIEFRYSKEYDAYFRTFDNDKKDLDTKLGPKTKAWLVPKGEIRPYLGGEIRKKQLYLGGGVVYYPWDRMSVEIGYINSFYTFKDVDREYNDHNRDEFTFFISGIFKW